MGRRDAESGLAAFLFSTWGLDFLGLTLLLVSSIISSGPSVWLAQPRRVQRCGLVWGEEGGEEAL